MFTETVWSLGFFVTGMFFVVLGTRAVDKNVYLILYSLHFLNEYKATPTAKNELESRIHSIVHGLWRMLFGVGLIVVAFTQFFVVIKEG